MGPLTLGLSRWTLALRFLPCRRAAPDFGIPFLRQGVPCQISTFSFRTVSLLARTSPGSAIRDPAEETLTTEQLMTAMGPVDEILDCDVWLHVYFDGPRRPQFGVSPRGSHGEAHGIPRLRTPCVPAFAHTVNETPGSSPRPLLIELGGEIDLRNAEALDDALCEAIDRTCAVLLVDLSTVPFIDSSGFRMMVRVHQHAAAWNCGVRWLGIQPAPARVAAAAGLDHVLHFEKIAPDFKRRGARRSWHVDSR